MSPRIAGTPAADYQVSALLGSLTIPGRAEHVAQARAFAAQTVGGNVSCADTVVLLVCELVTNSLRHSRSQRDSGRITVTIAAIPGGIRAEVGDEGSVTVPVLRPGPAGLSEQGRGLQLVDMLSTRWDYWADETGTITWFELMEPCG